MTTLRRLWLVLCVVPAVTWAEPSGAVQRRMAPRAAQRAADTKPIVIPTNARPQVDVYVGAPDTVPIELEENWKVVQTTRAVVVRDTVSRVELVPARPFAPGAQVNVTVDGIHAGTFLVGAGPDRASPTFDEAVLEAVTLGASARARFDTPARLRDEVQIRVRLHDDSPVRLRAFVTSPDGGRIESVSSTFIPNDVATPTLLAFPAGTFSGTTASVQLEARDLAGNVAASAVLEHAVPAPALTPTAAPSAAPATPAASAAPAAVSKPERRGCL